MTKALTTLGLIGSGIASIATIWAISMLFAYQGEAYRDPEVPDIQSKLQLLALLIALTPAILTSILAFRWLVYSVMPSLGLAYLPIAFGVIAGFTSYRLFEAGYQKGSSGRSKMIEKKAEQKAESVKNIRKKLADGQVSPCALLSEDPNASYEDFEKCRSHIDSLNSPEQRFREELHLLSGNFFEIRAFPSNKNLQFLKERDETWLLHSVFKDFFATHQSLEDEAARTKLLHLLQNLFEQWSNASVSTVVQEYFPVLKSRLINEAQWTDDMFQPSRQTFFGSKKTENNLIAYSIQRASHLVQNMKFLDDATTKIKPKLEAKGFRFTRKSYGKDTIDIFSEFKSGKGEIIKILISYWYPDDDKGPSPQSEPMLAVEWIVDQPKWSSMWSSSWEKSPDGDSRPRLQFRFNSSQPEIDRAIDSLIDVIDKNIHPNQ